MILHILIYNIISYITIKNNVHKHRRGREEKISEIGALG